MQPERFAQPNPAANPSDCTGYLRRLADLVDFSALARAVDETCPPLPGSDGHPHPGATECTMKAVLLQALYGDLADEAMEYLLLDRRSWREFAGIVDGGYRPDGQALRRFKQRLAPVGGTQAIFDAVAAQLMTAGYLPRHGRLLDMALVNAPDPAAMGQAQAERRERSDRRQHRLDHRSPLFDTRQQREQRASHRIDCQA